jgi:predicted phage-related endonuclease
MRTPRTKRLKVERFRIVSREQWLALRANDVTASGVGALFGLHPYQTPRGLFAEKTDVLTEDEDTVAMRRGRLLEDAVAKAYQERHPSYKILKARHYYRAAELRLGATPDFLMLDDKRQRAVLQAKTVAPLTFKRSWTDETPPTWISLQCLTEAMLTRAAYGVIAALVVDGWHFDLHEYVVPRHEAAERRICEAVAKFWDDVSHGRAPEFQPADRSLIATIYPRQTPGSTVDLRASNEWPTLLRRRERYKHLIEQATARQRAIETRLMAEMGLHETALVNDWRITFKQQHRKEYTVQATDFRVLRIAREKENA